MKTAMTFATSAALLAGLVLLGALSREPARGQTPKRGKTDKAKKQPVIRTGSELGVIGGTTPAEYEVIWRRDALKQFRAAKDAATKAKARKELSAALKYALDNDFKHREKEVSSIEARVKVLRSVLEKRRGARDKIIQLQLKVLVNEAQGLGFPTRVSSGNRSARFYPLIGPAILGADGALTPARSR